MFIITPRLFLRPLWLEDATAVHALISDWDIVSKLARAPWPYTPYDARVFADYAERAADAGTDMVLAICQRPSLDLIGCMGATPTESGSRELGYWLGKAYWGHGFVSEAAGAVVCGLFESLRVPVLTSGYHLDNPTSGRVLAKLGFVPTGQTLEMCRARGVQVDVQRMELQRQNWQLLAPQLAHLAKEMYQPAAQVK